jgi:cytochrome c-type biogenesis protein CcmH
MIWVAILVFAAVTVAPLALVLRRAADARGRREAALDLHRAQLAELDRDLAEGRIAPAEHASAVLEVQRRLLAAAAAPEAAAPRASRGPILVAMVLVPLTAFLLYLSGGQPEMPAMPLAQRVAEGRIEAQQEDAMINQLRQELAAMDPLSPKARDGYVLLGNAEQARGHWQAAADAWQRALNAGFDPTLAAETAEAISRADGRIGPASVALFRQALAAAPPDAPWRQLVEQRLAAAAAQK